MDEREKSSTNPISFACRKAVFLIYSEKRRVGTMYLKIALEELPKIKFAHAHATEHYDLRLGGIEHFLEIGCYLEGNTVWNLRKEIGFCTRYHSGICIWGSKKSEPTA
jgi:hypothetical protein